MLNGNVELWDANSPALGLVSLGTFDAFVGRIRSVAVNPQADAISVCSGTVVQVSSERHACFQRACLM